MEKRFDLRCFFARKAVVATIEKLNTPASLTLMLAAINPRTADQKNGVGGRIRTGVSKVENLVS